MKTNSSKISIDIVPSFNFFLFSNSSLAAIESINNAVDRPLNRVISFTIIWNKSWPSLRKQDSREKIPTKKVSIAKMLKEKIRTPQNIFQREVDSVLAWNVCNTDK